MNFPTLKPSVLSTDQEMIPAISYPEKNSHSALAYYTLLEMLDVFSLSAVQ
jgi:hypothetical protein